MKNIIAMIALCVVAAACNVGVNKDFTTGLTIKNNGFSVGEAMLVNDQSQKLSNNEVEMNSTIAIAVTEIGNYELKDGRAFPGLDLNVVDKDGTVVLNGNDILANDNGFSPEDASVLEGTITVGNPMKSGETYHAKMRIWDKIKPENEITVDVDIVVK